LSNVILRAVENGRPILRVTNSGISAYITPGGEVQDATGSFQTAVRTWKMGRNENAGTFYSRLGDLFVALTAVISVVIFAATFKRRKLATRG